MLLRLLFVLLTIPSFTARADDAKDLNEAWSRGIKAVANANYAAAKSEYSAVIKLARKLRLPAPQLSEFLLQAGQATALACDMQNAEQLLSESLELADKEEKSSTGGGTRDTNSFSATWKLFELAHFYSDRGLYETAYPYWHRFLPRYEKLNSTAAQDPIAYSMILGEYGKSLEAINKKQESEQIIKKSEGIAADNSELFTKIAWYKYGRNCK